MSDHKKQRVFIDLDEVVADLLTGFAALCNEKLGTNVTRESFQTWELATPLGIEPGMEDFIVGNLLSTPKLFAELKPIPGAIESVKRLMQDERLDVMFLSSSISRYSCSEKRNWVRHYFGEQGAIQLILVTRKDVIGQPGDILIDDRPRNVQEWKGTAILFEAPHNKTFKWPNRAANWEEALVRLDQIIFENQS